MRQELAAVTHSIIDEEISSINGTSERVFYTCSNGKKVVKGTNGDRERPSFFLFGSELEKECGPSGVKIFHTHGLGSGLPSYTDWESYIKHYQRFPMLVDQCSIGVDGMFCASKDGNLSKVPIPVDMKEKMLRETGTKTFFGHAVFCDKIGGNKNKFYCTVQNGNDVEQPIGIFDEVSMVGGVSWNGGHQSDASMFTPFKDKKIECFAATKGREKRLACVLDNYPVKSL